jgi:hypothetical protein
MGENLLAFTGLVIIVCSLLANIKLRFNQTKI